MSLKNRIKKIEKRKSMESGSKYYIHIGIRDNEDPDEGLKRYLVQNGLVLSQVGYALLVGEHGCFERDFGGYSDIKKLRGFEESNEALMALNTSSPTLGPPQCR